MRVLLTSLNSKYVHSNLAIRYLYESAKNICEIRVKEFNINQELFAVVSGITNQNADVMAFSCYIWNIEYTLKLCRILKQVNPSCQIILGGPEVSYDSEKVLKENAFIDFVTAGEGEEIFPMLLKAIISEQPFDSIKGLTYRKNNQVIKNEGFGIIEELSKIPFPYQSGLEDFQDRVIYYESSRGCPYSCTYCLSSTTKGVRYLPIDRVKEELQYFIDASVKQVKFVDRTFNCNKARAIEIWEYLINNGKSTSFHFEIAADLIDEDVLMVLSSAPKGMFDFEIGVQSTYKLALEAVCRNADFEKIGTAVEKLVEMKNINIHLDLIAGLPNEQYKDFKDSFNNVYMLNPDNLQLGFLKLLKGSKIREEAERYQYEFIQEPPYTILKNSSISFDEILKLIRIEELLERYYNSKRFVNSLKYFASKYHNPFVFYEKLSDYWNKKGCFERKIGQFELYDLLYEFYSNEEYEDLELFGEILKMDFVSNNMGAAQRSWQKRIVPENFKEIVRGLLCSDGFIEEYYPEIKGMAYVEQIKRVTFEFFDYDVLGSYEKKKTLIMFKKLANVRMGKEPSYIKINLLNGNFSRSKM